MAAEKSSGYYFDVEKWCGSKAVQRMSFLERGVYKEMLNEQWKRRSLPDDPQAVADLIALTPAQEAEVLVAWPVVRRKFVSSRGGGNCIYNVALERVRRVQRENRRKHQESGGRGGKAAAANRRKKKALEASDAVAPLEQSYSESNRSDLTRPDLTRRDMTLVQKGSGAESAPRTPAENVSVITKIVHEVLALGGIPDDELSEAVKSRCASLKIAYDATAVGKAIDSAREQRKRGKAS